MYNRAAGIGSVRYCITCDREPEPAMKEICGFWEDYGVPCSEM